MERPARRRTPEEVIAKWKNRYNIGDLEAQIRLYRKMHGEKQAKVETQSELGKAELRGRLDHVTGDLNRGAFYQHAAEHLQIGRLKDTLSELPTKRVFVHYVDLDGFKLLNDYLGHDQGDEFLRRISAILREHLPGFEINSTGKARDPGHLIARFGGDEFVILTDHAGVRDMAKFKTAVREMVKRELGENWKEKLIEKIGESRDKNQKKLGQLANKTSEKARLQKEQVEEKVRREKMALDALKSEEWHKVLGLRMGTASFSDEPSSSSKDYSTHLPWWGIGMMLKEEGETKKIDELIERMIKFAEAKQLEEKKDRAYAYR